MSTDSFDKTFEDIKEKFGVDHENAGGGFEEDPNANDEKKLVDPNAEEPKSFKGQIGGKRPGAGRPKGSKNQFAKQSVERLKELNFDPIAAMVELYHEVAQAISEMEDPNHSRRYSAQGLSSLLINKQKIVTDLLRYGYRHVPEKLEVETTEKAPFQVNLTGVKIESKVEDIPAVEYEEIKDEREEQPEAPQDGGD